MRHFISLLLFCLITGCSAVDSVKSRVQGGASCESGGNTYKSGEKWYDGCNNCTCNDGRASCTKRGCPDRGDVCLKAVVTAADAAAYEAAGCPAKAVACKSDANCTGITAGCFEITAVQSEYKDIYSSFLTVKAESQDCLAPRAVESFDTACVDSVCKESEVVFAETDSRNECKADSDCWCRVFDGKEFGSGRAPSTCKDGTCSACQYPEQQPAGE